MGEPGRWRGALPPRVLLDSESWFGNDVAIFQWFGSIPLWYLVIGLLKNRQLGGLGFVAAVFTSSPVPFFVAVVASRESVNDDLVGLCLVVGGLATVGYGLGVLGHRFICYRMTYSGLRQRRLTGTLRRMPASVWAAAALAFFVVAGGASLLIWWDSAPKTNRPAVATDHPYARGIRFERQFEWTGERTRFVGGVVQNGGSRYVRSLELALAVVDDQDRILNTARQSPLRWGDVNLAPEEKVGVVFQVYPEREGRLRFVVEKLEAGLPATHAPELRPLDVVLSARAGVDSVEGILVHRVRHERLDWEGGHSRSSSTSRT